MDFNTPRCKREATFHEMNEDSTDENDNDVSTSVVAVSSSISFTASNLRPQESSIHLGSLLFCH